MASCSYQFRSDPYKIANICTQIQDWLFKGGYETDLRDRTHIVLAEILNNVAEHAYRGQIDGIISLVMHSYQDALSITVTDSGCPFPGVPSQGMPKLSQDDLNAMPEGGFGWALIQSLSSDIKYNYIGEQNVLRVTLKSYRPACVVS